MYVFKILLSKFRSSNSRNETTRNDSRATLGRISTTGEQIRGAVPGTEIVHLRGGIVTRGIRQGESLFTKLSIVIERGTTGPRTAQFERRGIFMTPVSSLSLFGPSTDPSLTDAQRMGSRRREKEALIRGPVSVPFPSPLLLPFASFFDLRSFPRFRLAFLPATSARVSVLPSNSIQQRERERERSSNSPPSPPRGPLLAEKSIPRNAPNFHPSRPRCARNRNVFFFSLLPLPLCLRYTEMDRGSFLPFTAADS